MSRVLLACQHSSNSTPGMLLRISMRLGLKISSRSFMSRLSFSGIGAALRGGPVPGDAVDLDVGAIHGLSLGVQPACLKPQPEHVEHRLPRCRRALGLPRKECLLKKLFLAL